MKRIGKRILIVSVVWVAFGSMPFVRSEALSISQTADSIQSGVIAFVDGPVRLGSGSARVTLEPVAEANTERRTLAAQIEALARGRHIYLVVRDLCACTTEKAPLGEYVHSASAVRSREV